MQILNDQKWASFQGLILNGNLNVVYFDQLVGAARTQKLVKTFFSAIFEPHYSNQSVFEHILVLPWEN